MYKNHMNTGISTTSTGERRISEPSTHNLWCLIMDFNGALFFHTWHRLVLSVRGSCEWSAVLTDVAAEESLLAGGLAHSGMARAARHLWEEKISGKKNGGCPGILVSE